MPATSTVPPPRRRRHRVVVLCQHAAELPPAPPWPSDRAVRSIVWCAEPVPEPGADGAWWTRARQTSSPSPGAPPAGLRGSISRIRAAAPLGRRDDGTGWAQALASDQGLARDLRSAELVVALDGASTAALTTHPQIAGGVPALVAHDLAPAAPVGRSLAVWDHVLGALEAMVAAPRARGEGTDDPPGDAQAVAALAPLADQVRGLVAVPAALSDGLLDRTEEASRAVAGLRDARATAAIETVLVPMLRAVAPQEAHRLDLAAASAALVSGSWQPTEAQLADAVRRTFEAADAALHEGREHLAVTRAHDAIGLLLHRSRHAALRPSPLATGAPELLRAFDDSRVATLFRGAGPVGGPAAPADGRAEAPRRPRVLVLPGAYGAFHQDLMAALADVADVTASDLLHEARLLRRRRPRVSDLELIAALRRGEIDIAEGRWRDDPRRTRLLRRDLDALRALWAEMCTADVVVSDWIDTGALWASQVCPPGVRLVLRAHSLDLVDPWVQLMDWRAVDEVMISNAGMAALYRGVTAGRGAPAGVTVRPFLPDLAGWGTAKDPATRFTIGMVGWGRIPKDPAWALELLERDERRRLVLIGPGPGEQPHAEAAAYYRDLLERMERPGLRERIHVVGATTDVRGALAEVGVILSSSIREGWHLGLIEGAATGAVPVVRDWPSVAPGGGARSLFPDAWVVPDLDAADARIASLADPDAWDVASQQAARDVLELFAPEPAARVYRAAVLGSSAPSSGSSAR